MNEKISKSIKFLQDLETEKECSLGFSGGKDSILILDLAKKSGIKFKPIHSNTTIDPPGTLKFIREKYPEVEIIHPDLSFYQLIIKKGLPNGRRTSLGKSGKEQKSERQDSKYRRPQIASNPDKFNDDNSGHGAGKTSQFKTPGIFKNITNTNIKGLQRHGGLQECSKKFLAWSGSEPLEGIWQSEPELGRVAHGIPDRVDRLKGLGNAIVPQIAFEFFKIIDKINESN